MLEGKNGKEFEALVPIEVACMAMYCGAYYNDSRISRIGYSVVRKIHNFCLGKARNTSQRAQLNNEVKTLFAAMECSKSILFTNGVELYED